MKQHSSSNFSTTQNKTPKTKRRLAIFGAALVAFALVLSATFLPTAYARNGNPTLLNRSPVARATNGSGSATVMVYLNGSDLESEAGEATSDIAEMLESGIGANANVVIQTLGTREWQNFGIASDHTQRYLVNQGKLELVDDSLGQLDTTSPNTLSDFISWGAKNYPADRYILVMWDHGAGPVYGFGYDEFQKEESALTLDEMKQALDTANVHFDMIGMDCCIMGSLETCIALQPYCDYTVLSEDFVPGIGWSYKGWMNKLEQNSGISTVELGTAIVDDMIADVSQDAENGDATLALIDESAVDELYAAWKSFAYANADQLIGTDYSQETQWRTRPNQASASSKRPGLEYGQNSPNAHGDMPYATDEWGAWDEYAFPMGNDGYGYGTNDNSYDTHGFGDQFDWNNLWDSWNSDGSYVTMTDYFVTDIMEVANSIQNDQATALKEAFSNVMVHYASTSGEQGMSGLSITLPYGDAEFYDQLTQVFGACGIDQEYIDWLKAFVNTQRTEDSLGYQDNGNEDYDYNMGAPLNNGDNDYSYDMDMPFGNGNSGYDYDMSYPLSNEFQFVA